MTAAMAAALGEMVLGLAERRGEGAPDLRDRLSGLRQRFVETAEEDGRAFEAVLVELRRPKDDPRRKAALAASLTAAGKVPLKTLRLIEDLAGRLHEAAGHCPRSAVSDLTAAWALVEAARTIAKANVQANLSGADARGQLEEELQRHEERFSALRS